ncbi:hypothetical protein Goarm_005039 [Gossypium armourianum]|uniref:Uncharacterized protein n=1 Tax=Gossypium armourianum TaxID=34283 RepID=A0A7J9JYM5_9ROSI|nr:hypothetical protein [Gossypium armourianum]
MALLLLGDLCVTRMWGGLSVLLDIWAYAQL